MENIQILRDYGLFDAKVPRYTSYPPANRFEPNIGARMQPGWLGALPRQAPVSIYVHIPFCRRLCWFCACRTQGTQTLSPVDAYIGDVTTEIGLVAGRLPSGMQMARLHLGGGTPTLLSPAQMTQLLDAIHRHFTPTTDFEFSVEIDPTEAAPAVLEVLAERGMQRASIGIQDFDPKVQNAIGRLQSCDQTRDVIDVLRTNGVDSLNVDLLYGLPFQNEVSLLKTLEHVGQLRPDRVALYGYAHVPHMSKRQTMIPGDALPSTIERFEMAQTAKRSLEFEGYHTIGIDHFGLATDSLTKAAQTGKLRRNFQGYTDDPCETLLGFGASAISKVKQGYWQNAVATAAYQTRVREDRLAGHKGYVLQPNDELIADVVEQLMCQSALDVGQLKSRHPQFDNEIEVLVRQLDCSFPKAFEHTRHKMSLGPGMEALARVAAAAVDTALCPEHKHSVAI